MRKYLRYANLLALGAGVLGMLLAFWLFSADVDEKGLYPANHIAWILLGILTVATVAALWLLSRHAGTNRSYKQNFPASLPGAFGCVMAAVGMLSGGIAMLKSGSSLGLLIGVVGIVGAVPLLWAAVCRFQGQTCKRPVHILPCFFFALQLFALGQKYGSEPELCRYLYRFWAIVTMVPACYWLWSFDVNLGKRPDCIFWCLVAGYCNLVAAIGSGQALMHLAVAAWMLTALPVLCYLPKPSKHAAAPAAEPTPDAAEPAPIAPVAEDAATPADPLAVELPDADAILEELLRDFGNKENP